MGPPNHTELDVDQTGWQPGTVVGRYRMLSRIAIGGMAEIWLALQQGLKGFERVVVVKRISESLSQDSSFVEMFLDEARIAAQLNHPNIVQIYDLGEHDGAFYIAMEYLHGEDLAGVVRAAVNARNPLSPAFAARVVASAAEGLASAHARVGLDGKPLNVVHRDVSPQNIFITYDGIVKVLDFGVAKARSRASITQAGQVKGKFSYMSPEQARGEDVDPRTDVWGLGVVLFETATHSRLFEGKEDQLAARQAVLHEAIPSARARNPLVPKELDAIISCCLERDLALRTPSAEALHRELEQWLKGRKDDPNTSTIAQTMSELFGDRIAEKSQLIESVRVGEVRLAQLPAVLRPPAERSMPDVAPVQEPKRGRRWALVAAALLLVAAISVLAWALALRARTGTLEVKAPPGALVLLDETWAGTAPLTLKDVKPGSHEVVVELGGQRSESRRVTVQAGARAMVELAPSAPPPAAPIVEVKPEAVVEVKPQPEPPAAPTPKPADEPRPAKGSAARAKKAGKGRLTLDTTPWAQVTEGGKVLGDTPLLERPLPAGRHTLKLTNPDKELSRTVVVEIKEGQTTVMKLKL